MHLLHGRDVRQTLSEQSIRSDGSSSGVNNAIIVDHRGGRRGGHARSASAEILQNVRLSVKKKYFVLGTILILIGWLCFVQGIEAVQQNAFLSHVGSGLWGGVAIFVAGLTSLALSIHSCATARNASKAHIKWLRYTLQACIAFSVIIFVFSLFALFGDAGMLYNDEEVGSDTHAVHEQHHGDAASVHHFPHNAHTSPPQPPLPSHHVYGPATLTTGKARRMIIDVLLILCSLIAIACSHSLNTRATKDLNELRRLPSMFMTDNVSGITSITTRSTNSAANMLLPVTMTTFGMFNQYNNTGSPVDSEESGVRSLGAVPPHGVSAAPPPPTSGFANSIWSRNNNKTNVKVPINWHHSPTYDDTLELSDYSAASRTASATTTVIHDDISSEAGMRGMYNNNNNNSNSNFIPSFQRSAMYAHLNKIRNGVRKSLGK